MNESFGKRIILCIVAIVLIELARVFHVYGASGAVIALATGMSYRWGRKDAVDDVRSTLDREQQLPRANIRRRSGW